MKFSLWTFAAWAVLVVSARGKDASRWFDQLWSNLDAIVPCAPCVGHFRTNRAAIGDRGSAEERVLALRQAVDAANGHAASPPLTLAKQRAFGESVLRSETETEGEAPRSRILWRFLIAAALAHDMGEVPPATGARDAAVAMVHLWPGFSAQQLQAWDAEATSLFTAHPTTSWLAELRVWARVGGIALPSEEALQEAFDVHGNGACTGDSCSNVAPHDLAARVLGSTAPQPDFTLIGLLVIALIAVTILGLCCAITVRRRLRD